MDKIDEIIERTAKTVVLELRSRNMFKDDGQSTYQKTESLLYNYINFLNIIDEKKMEIKSIKNEGLSKCINLDMIRISTSENKSELEKEMDVIKSLENSITITQKFLNVLNHSLSILKDDIYYEIIPMIYFEKLTRDQVADNFNVDVKTISRNKNRLVKKIEVQLFSDEYIYNIFN